MPLEVGERAPNFTLPTKSWDENVTLNELTREGPVVLIFYPGDWSSVCTDQMQQLQEQSGKFDEKGAKLLAVSADTPWSHKAFAEDRGVEFPLLSDFDREVIRAYGVEHEVGFPERAYFVIDREGVVRARKVEASPKDKPEVEEILKDLGEAL